jgi:glyoxylase-like metal-dependent hydrolase (beta-lactamase superfamily II)
MKVDAFICGHLECEKRVFLPDQPKGLRWKIPIPSFLIEHPKGRVLFDTGIVGLSKTKIGGVFPGWFNRNFYLHYHDQESLINQLANQGIHPRTIRYIINSHLHIDHCSGNAFFSNAKIFVQQNELDWANNPHNDYALQESFLGQNCDFRPVNGEHDLFGDGRLILIPTPGHTPGHQSLLIRSDSKEILLIGDACVTKENMIRNILGPVASDPEDWYLTVKWLRDLEKEKGIVLIFGHDPLQWNEFGDVPVSLI